MKVHKNQLQQELNGRKNILKQTTLTKSEREIMDLLWNTDRPLTATEIVNLTPERAWKKSYIHLLINSLLEKELIKSETLVRTGRNFGRAFTAVSTKEQFEIRQITQSRSFSQDSIKALFEALLESVEDPSILNDLDQILQEKRLAAGLRS
ncbi:MAG: BlaI/MecI/CopY family transcriptional regulator [Clostridiales bacterium]|nr:BlaI/MecI/CopY family transcriptional regulator [Clostridiales bacterium]